MPNKQLLLPLERETLPHPRLSYQKKGVSTPTNKAARNIGHVCPFLEPVHVSYKGDKGQRVVQKIGPGLAIQKSGHDPPILFFLNMSKSSFPEERDMVPPHPRRVNITIPSSSFTQWQTSQYFFQRKEIHGSSSSFFQRGGEGTATHYRTKRKGAWAHVFLHGTHPSFLQG